jgi:hypothetical protein
MPCGRSTRRRRCWPRDPRAQAEVVEVELDTAAVEHAHDARLAEHGRQRRDAQVDRRPPIVELDAAVLRHARLGDVEVAMTLTREISAIARCGGGASISYSTPSTR